MIGEGVSFEKISTEESWAIFDAISRRYLNLSGDEFVRRLDEGETIPGELHLIEKVTMLRPSSPRDT